MDEKRILLAIALSIVIMVGWYALFPPPKPEPPAEPVQIDQPTGLDSSTVPERAPAEQPVVTTETEPYAAADAITASSEERSTIDNQHFTAEFTNVGARLISFRLRD